MSQRNNNEGLDNLYKTQLFNSAKTNQEKSMTNKPNPQQILFMRPVDELMKLYSESDKQYFCLLFERKKQLINSFMQSEVNAQKYMSVLTKLFKIQDWQKQYVRAELLVFRDKHNKEKQSWFQQCMTSTQQLYGEQQQLYNKYQEAKQKKPEQKPVNKSQKGQPQPAQINPGLNIVEFTNFKLFDHFMSKYYETPYKATFIELYEKKLRIVQALETGALKPQVYLQMSQKAYSQTKNEQVKKTLKTDLDMLVDLHDGKVESWVKQALKETKQQLQMQKETYQMHKKGQIVNKRQVKTDLNLSDMGQEPIPDVDLKQLVSFVVIDRYLSQKKQNPQIYITLYEKKQNLLNMIEDKKLNEQMYREFIVRKSKTAEKYFSNIFSETLRDIYQNQLNDIQDVYENNLSQWFSFSIDETKTNIMLQQDIYEKHKKQFKPVKKQEPAAKTKNIQTKSNEVVSSKEESKKLTSNETLPYSFNAEKMYSLKVLQNAILMHGSNEKAFFKLFSQKNKIIQMMKNGQLDAAKYKKFQQSLIKEFAKNEEVKDQIQFDLAAIQDEHDGNADEWFKDVVNSAGQYYETQLQRYQQLKNKFDDETSNDSKQVKKSKEIQKTEQNSQMKSRNTKSQKEQPEPFKVSKLFSLKVLDDALIKYKDNQKLFVKLFAQKLLIFEKMQNGEIDAKKYHKLQQKMLEEFADNEEIKDQISFQIEEIEDMHDGDVQKWFQEVVNNAGFAYEAQLKRYEQLNKNSNKEQRSIEPTTFPKLAHESSKESNDNRSIKQKFDSQLLQAEEHINQASSKSKIRFYLQKMAVWESLASYFQKNQISSEKNDLLKLYLTVPRQQIEQTIQRIKTQPQFNIVSYCKKFFPPITEAIFFHGIQNPEQKLTQAINSCNKEIDSLKQYTKNLRKGLNTKNLQKVKQKIAQCQQNIKYLTDFMKKSGKLIPFPLIEEVPVSYPNMDQYTHLDPLEVQMKISKIEGLDEEQIMKVYFLNSKLNEEHIKNGNKNIIVKGKAPDQDTFMKILKGDLKCFTISIYKKGWFSNTKLGQQGAEMMFIRSNTHEAKVKIGNATIYYEAKVRIAKTPLMTEIREIRVTKYLPYEHSKKIQQEFISQHTSSSK